VLWHIVSLGKHIHVSTVPKGIITFRTFYFMNFHHETMDKLHKVSDSEADVRLGSNITTLTTYVKIASTM